MVLILLVLLGVMPFVGLSVVALTAPYTSVAVPAACARTTPSVPPDRTVPIPGHGSGILLAEAADRAVAVEVGSSPAPRPIAAYLIDRSTEHILWEVPIQSGVVVVAIDGGIVFLWDDKIGLTVSAATGAPLGALVRSDDYRGAYTDGGVRRLQLDAEVTAIGLGGELFSHRTFALAGVIDGCSFGL